MQPILRLIAAAIIALAATSSQAAEPKVDPASVKGVAIAYVEAFVKADSAAMRKHSIGTEAQYTAAENIAKMLVAVGQFQAAATAKFGANNPLAGQAIGPMPDLLADVKTSEFNISGDTASQSDKRTDTRRPMRLVRVENAWKVDLQSLTHDAEGAGRHAAAVSKLLIEAAAEISAGVYPDADAAAKVIGPRLLNAVR